MIQNEIFNDKSFQCEVHPQQSMKLICFAEKCPYKRRFLCLKCLLEEKKEQDNIATLQDFIQDPISILDKNKEYQQLNRNKCDELIVQIDEFKVMLQQVQQDILLSLDDLKVQVSSKIKNDQQAQEEVLKRLKFNEFQQQLSLIWKMDAYQGTQEFSVLEQQLNNIISSWKECSQQICTQQAKQSQDIQQQLSIKMENKWKLEKNLYENLVQLLSSIFAELQTEIPSFILQKITMGKQIKYDLIYQGTRDGLTTSNYWQKCNKQSHLLTIIMLKNGNIFGGYTPLQIILKDPGYWAVDPAYWAVDDTNQSFVFQQNKQEIYKQKEKQSTIYCSKDYGPNFGNDFYVHTDFKQISSTLGSQYDITGFNVENQKTHLIGDKDTEIVECKVYKITFL